MQEAAATVELMEWEGVNSHQTLNYKYDAPVSKMDQCKNDIVGGFTLNMMQQLYIVA